jgi:hypothetical protein
LDLVSQLFQGGVQVARHEVCRGCEGGEGNLGPGPSVSMSAYAS